MKRLLVSVSVSALILGLIMTLLILATFQEKLIYPGIENPQILLKEPFEQINDSFYKRGSTGKLWLFFGGNKSKSTDFVDINSKHSFLIITYPGYNGTMSNPNPETTYDTIEKCIKKVCSKGYENKNINFMCYSIGCAIALNYLSKSKLPINKLILCAPFWSLDEIVHSKYPFPKFLIKQLMNHNWENDKIKDIHHEINVTILHGKNDKLIHYSHSERLAKLRKSKLILTEHDHTSIRTRIPEYLNT